MVLYPCLFFWYPIMIWIACYGVVSVSFFFYLLFLCRQQWWAVRIFIYTHPSSATLALLTINTSFMSIIGYNLVLFKFPSRHETTRDEEKNKNYRTLRGVMLIDYKPEQIKRVKPIYIYIYICECTLYSRALNFSL